MYMSISFRYGRGIVAFYSSQHCAQLLLDDYPCFHVDERGEDEIEGGECKTE